MCCNYYARMLLCVRRRNYLPFSSPFLCSPFLFFLFSHHTQTHTHSVDNTRSRRKPPVSSVVDRTASASKALRDNNSRASHSDTYTPVHAGFSGASVDTSWESNNMSFDGGSSPIVGSIPNYNANNNLRGSMGMTMPIGIGMHGAGAGAGLGPIPASSAKKSVKFDSRDNLNDSTYSMGASGGALSVGGATPTGQNMSTGSSRLDPFSTSKLSMSTLRGGGHISMNTDSSSPGSALKHSNNNNMAGSSSSINSSRIHSANNTPIFDGRLQAGWSNWVIVYGFSADNVSIESLLQKFQAFGDIMNHKRSSGNWLFIK